MFKNIVEIMNMATKGFSKPYDLTSSSKSHRELYFFYLNIENVIKYSSLIINHCFTTDVVHLSKDEFDVQYGYMPVDLRPKVPYDRSNIKMPIERWFFWVENDLSELNDSMEKFIYSMRAGYSYHPDAELIKQLDKLLNMSGILKFLHIFNVGSLSSDGEKLKNKSLLLPYQKGFKSINGSSLEDYKDQLIVNEFDISSVEKRLKLAKEAHEQIQAILAIKSRLKTFIEENINLKQLL